MKKLFRCVKSFRYHYAKIHLVDKCLLLFMLVLLLQSAYSLFVSPGASGEAHTIDVIVRTSISGIFGYFLSANFIRDELSVPSQSSKPKTPVTLNHVGDAAVKGSIGFASSKPDTDLNRGGADYRPVQDAEIEKKIIGRLQIIVATFIGLFCLIILILVRNIGVPQSLDSTASSFIATVSQFRDLVSSCVGFLIGCPTVKKIN